MDLAGIRRRLLVGGRWVQIALQTRCRAQVQKFTIELRDPRRHDNRLCQIWHAKTLPRRRLEQEHVMLRRLPAGLGPTPLKFGDFGNGTALLMTPLRGRPVASQLPPAPGMLEFVRSLETAVPLALAIASLRPCVSRARGAQARHRP